MQFFEAFVNAVTERLRSVNEPEGDRQDHFRRSVATEDARREGESVVDHAEAETGIGFKFHPNLVH